MRAVRGWPSHKKLGIEGDATIGAGVELHHPALDAIRIELGIDGPIEGIGEVDPLTVTADLDHLWAAAERPVLGTGVRSLADDPTDPHLARELRVEGIGNVVLLQIAGAPAGDVEVAIIHGQIDIGDEGRDRLETFEQWRQIRLTGRLGRDLDHLFNGPFVAVLVPGPDRGGEVLQADDAVDEAIGFGWVVCRAQLEYQLVLVAKVDGLQVLALVQIPEMQAPTVFCTQENLGDEAIFES